jgi:hypothetical protein
MCARKAHPSPCDDTVSQSYQHGVIPHPVVGFERGDYEANPRIHLSVHGSRDLVRVKYCPDRSSSGDRRPREQTETEEKHSLRARVTIVTCAVVMSDALCMRALCTVRVLCVCAICGLLIRVFAWMYMCACAWVHAVEFDWFYSQPVVEFDCLQWCLLARALTIFHSIDRGEVQVNIEGMSMYASTHACTKKRAARARVLANPRRTSYLVTAAVMHRVEC